MIDLINSTSHKLPVKKTIWQWICSEINTNLQPARHLRGGRMDSSEVKEVSAGNTSNICNKWLVEVDFVSVDRIHKLNKQYRNIDKPTDVLSFPVWNKADEALANTDNALGTIVICFDIAKQQAHFHNHSVEKEIELLIRHSVRHLLGLHHS
jgi:rRNA maturation RNase YbeY